MIKKVITLLFLPYAIFMLLEGCYDNYCDRKETRNITHIEISQEVDTYTKRETIYLNLEYESYFVTNFKPNLLRKAYAKSIDEIDNRVYLNPCFEGYSNTIETISIISANDFNSQHLAGTEINSIFRNDDSYNNLDDFRLEAADYYPKSDTKISILNDTLPTLDSIHTLYFNIYCADGKTYLDTLTNVNLNKTVSPYHQYL